MSRVRLLVDPVRQPGARRLAAWLDALLDGGPPPRGGVVARIRRRIGKGSAPWVDIGWPPRGAPLLVPTGPPPTGIPPTVRAVLALTPEAAEALRTSPAPAAAVMPAPYPVPTVFYAPGDTRLVHRASRDLRLHERPRLVYLGPYDDGRALTRALDTARRLLATSGELVLPGSLPWRAGLAPVVARLGLAERVVFTPPLDDALWAGVLLGADLALAPARPDGVWPVEWLPVLAAGLPLVAADGPLTRQVAGTAALLVDPGRDEVWPEAARTVLYRERVRTELAARALARAAEFHEDEARAAWRAAVDRWIAPGSA
ncbi:MAG: glycosyltransferase [Actinomycetia bacterium]|nr:glycosyltransferase [Actinomycetes bacterium]